MNKLSNQPEVEAASVGIALAASGYAGAAGHAFDADLGSAFGRLRAFVAGRFERLAGIPGAANFLRSLHGRFDWRGNRVQRFATAAKYVARALCMPREHDRYLDFVHGNSRMSAYRRRDPRMLERHFHRYIHLQWSRPARLQSIQRHYRFALEHLPGTLFEAIYIYGNATLGSLILKDGSQLKLCLRPPIFMGCEGELCIQLSDADDHPVYRIVLTVIDERPTIAIGCIQGPDGERGRDMVRDLTRNMHGLRPKQLMLSLAYAFARHYGITRILAVSNMAHPLRKARDKFRADYDAFWQEQQGQDTGNGWFRLPETPNRKSESDVPSQHRSAFRRREALRVEAERLLTDALLAFPPRKSVVQAREALESVRSFQHDGLAASWTC